MSDISAAALRFRLSEIDDACLEFSTLFLLFGLE